MNKSFLALLILAPTLAWSLGSPFRGLFGSNMYQPLFSQPIGINSDCSYKYRSSDPQVMIRQFDAVCMTIQQSKPVEVSPTCTYSDYKPDQSFKDLHVRLQQKSHYIKTLEDSSKSFRFGAANLQAVQAIQAQSLTSPTGYLEFEVLVGRYCQRQVPQSAQNAFAANVDVPAEVISFWDEDYITYLWNEAMPTLRLRDRDVDYQSIADLNIYGARLWKKMLECSDNDPELARSNYFKAEFTTCADGDALKDQIKNYVGSVRSFFTTSLLAMPELKHKESYMVEHAISRQESLLKSRYESLPTYHPMFSQAILQILVDIYPVGRRDSKDIRDLGKRMNATEIEGSHMLAWIAQLDILSPFGMSPWGLWPSANLTVQARIQRVRMEMLQQVLKNLELKDFDDFAFGPYHRMPRWYHENQKDLPLEVRKLNQRYGM